MHSVDDTADADQQRHEPRCNQDVTQLHEMDYSSAVSLGGQLHSLRGHLLSSRTEVQHSISVDYQRIRKILASINPHQY